MAKSWRDQYEYLWWPGRAAYSVSAGKMFVDLAHLHFVASLEGEAWRVSWNGVRHPGIFDVPILGLQEVMREVSLRGLPRDRLEGLRRAVFSADKQLKAWAKAERRAERNRRLVARGMLGFAACRVCGATE